MVNGGRRVKAGAQKTWGGLKATGRGVRRVGRATVKAWNSKKGRSARKRTRAALAKTWGVVGPGSGAALAFLANLPRGFKSAYSAAGRVWRKLRAKWAKKSKHAKAAEAVKPPELTTPAETVKRPVTMTGGSTNPAAVPAGLTGGVSMAQARIIEASREMVGAAIMYHPESMMQIGNDFASFPEVIANVANAIKGMTQQVQDGETPMHAAIVDQVKALYAELVRASENAKELQPAFERLHAVDISRIRNPRPGEKMWDYTVNRDYADL